MVSRQPAFRETGVPAGPPRPRAAPGRDTLSANMSETATPWKFRQYGRTGLTYCMIVDCSEPEQSHRQKEAGHGEGYYIRGAR